MTREPSTSGTEPSRNRTETRERIITAAAEVIAARGVSRSTTRAVAAEAGVSEAAIYVYFTSKRELFAAVIRERLFLPSVFAALPDPGSTKPVKRILVDFTGAMIDQLMPMIPLACACLSDAELAELLLETPPGSGRFEGLERLSSYLAGEQAAGRIGSSAAPIMLTRILFASAFHHCFLSRLFGEERLKPRGRAFVQQLVDTVLAAAGPAPIAQKSGGSPRRTSLVEEPLGRAELSGRAP